MKEITHEEAKKKALLIRHGNQRYHYDEIEKAYDELLDYITQQQAKEERDNELKVKVKIYFEMNEYNEDGSWQDFLELEKEIKKMVGIE